jgi:hypothetical protein
MTTTEPPVPRWDNEPAVIDYVRRLIDQSRKPKYNNRRNLLFGRLPFGSSLSPGLEPFGSPRNPRRELSDIIEIESERAITAAWGGNYAPLARLLDSKHPLNNARYEIELRRALPAEAYDLIAGDKVKRSAGGKVKRPRGRPRLTYEERRANNPVHNAADDVPIVRNILRRLYPKQLKKQIDDRAVSVAAKLHKIKGKTLRYHLKRPKSDHRRLQRP